MNRTHRKKKGVSCGAFDASSKYNDPISSSPTNILTKAIIAFGNVLNSTLNEPNDKYAEQANPMMVGIAKNKMLVTCEHDCFIVAHTR